MDKVAASSETISLWTSTSWQKKPIAQAIPYKDEEGLMVSLNRLSKLPDLVPLHEIDHLGQLLAYAARGQAFVIQGGDCAEAFQDVQSEIVGLKRDLLVDQSKKLREGLGVPVVTIGRIAGQYSKPRSNCFERLQSGTQICAYRGDNINGPDQDSRTPDPERLCMGYHLSAVTLSMLRLANQNERDADSLASLVYTSHESLHLPGETAMTRCSYNTSAHMLWLGERTRSLDGAHVEYMRGLRNPVGVKLGPGASPSELAELLDILSPNKTVGKVTLITRLGAQNVENKLPSLIRAVKEAGHLPVWLCDPCHGNTVITPTKTKTRLFDEMLAEVKASHAIHLREGSRLGGLHLEQTGEDITECADCSRADLKDTSFPNFRSLCDPRLSGKQAREFVAQYIDFARSFQFKGTEARALKSSMAVSVAIVGERSVEESKTTIVQGGPCVLPRNGTVLRFEVN